MDEDGKARGNFDGREVFRSLYLHMLEGVALHELVCDADGNPTNYRILDVNPQFDRYVGVGAAQAIGKLATEVYGTKDPPYLAEYAHVVLGGQPARFETYFEAFDRTYDVSVVPFGTGQFATIFLDVSEQRRSERALRESEWLLQRAEHVAHIGSFRFDIAKGTWTNSAALNELLGIGDEFKRDFAGLLSLVHPDDREDMHRYLSEDVITAGRDYDRRCRMVRANDGSVRWFHGMGELVKDSSGQPIFIIGILQDVTDSTLKEQHLRVSEERLRRIFDLMPDPVFLASADGKIVSCNDAFCAAAGYPREESLGKTTRELLLWVDLALRDAMYSEVTQGRRVEWLETKLRTRNGQVRTVQLFARPFDLDGKIMVLATARDITEQRNLEQQMLHSQKLESLGVLAGGIAHDFNNLLTGILGNADLAKTEMSPLAPSRASLEGIEVAARRAADLCRQLLAYSGRGRFIIEFLNLEELVEEMGHLLSVSISKKVMLQYHFSQGIPAVEADATQVRQVMMNLIVNASEAIGDRSGVISVTVGQLRCEADYLKGCFGADRLQPGDYVYLEVADTGRGMDKATQDRIFDPFFSTKFTGRGLGLAAVLGIMRGHHGAIKVYSELNRGTTFKLLFPASESSASRLSPKATLPGAYHASGKILLADDEETILNLGRRMLQRAGFEVIVAADGREALEKFASDKDSLSLVILDLTMPYSDGETCYREMRLLKPDVKVILSSGYNEQDIVSRFAGKGLSGFVQKPYTMEELLGKVREALEKK
jgi:PAS domain S-box-containing protein